MIAWAEEAGNGDRGTLILAKVPDTKAERVNSENAQPQAYPDLIMDASLVSHVRVNKWVGDIKFVNGHSSISLTSATLYAKGLVRAESSKSTFHFIRNGNLFFDQDLSEYAINEGGGHAIVPWASVDNIECNDDLFSFAFIWKNGSGYYLEEKSEWLERNVA